MALTVFSILGVACAFLGLGVFIISMIALLPVNVYNAIMSCIKLQHAIPLLNKNIIPTLFFGGNILIAFITVGLFYMITKVGRGKTDNGGSTTNSKKSSVANNQISNHNVFSHHKHSLLNGYTYAYVTIDFIWALIGSFLLYTIISNNSANNADDGNKKKITLVIDAMRSQVSILWINLVVLAVAACTMGISSLFFVLGRKKRSNNDETGPLLFSVV